MSRAKEGKEVAWAGYKAGMVLPGVLALCVLGGGRGARGGRVQSGWGGGSSNQLPSRACVDSCAEWGGRMEGKGGGKTGPPPHPGLDKGQSVVSGWVGEWVVAWGGVGFMGMGWVTHNK